MSDKSEVVKGERTHQQNGVGAALQAAKAGGILRNRQKKTQRKKKLSKFERKFTALGPLLKPELKRVDYVLVHKVRHSEDEQDEDKKEALKKKEALRKKFEDALRSEGFSVKSIELGDTVYKKLHCPFKRLCKEAETVKLELPLKGCEKYPPERTTCITEFVEAHFETDNEVDFISAPFKMNKIDLFEGYDNPTFFFRPSLRSLLTHHILINLDIRSKDETDGTALQKRGVTGQLRTSSIEDHFEQEQQDGYNTCRNDGAGKRRHNVVEDFIVDLCSCCPGLFACKKEDEDDEDYVLSTMGLKYLLMKEVYTDAYTLHEDSEIKRDKELQNKKKDGKSRLPSENDADIKPSLISDPRKELDETWTTWWKFQPLWKIRNYFGEKIAIYFAWCGMLLTSLWIPLLFGLACFIYGLVESASRASTVEEMPRNLTLQQELRWRMGELYDTLRGSFDNQLTPFFALVICLWGTVFLELWKRHDARLAYEWDVDQFEQNEPDRPQFFGTKVKKDPVTQEDNWFYPFKRQMLKFCLSASALIFMICIVAISVAAVIVYRVIVSVDYCTSLTAVECLFTTTIVSAVLNAISILLLGKFYDWVAFKLTEWENHRTQTQYDNALIIKLFAFSFANSYASCFYIAFFRGRFDAFGVFGLGEEYKDDCEGDNCMAHLSFQVLILMLAKPFPKFAKDILLPFVKWLWRRRPACCHSNCCNNQVEDEEKPVVKSDSASLKKSKMFLKTERLKPDLGDFTLSEYTEKVIMYGFLMLFAASFPLAPFIALVWLAIDVRIDAKRLLWLNRRPIAFIAQDIGMWYSILNFVNLIGVISNGFLIAFTSSWGSKYSLVTRLWLCIGFEHIVFALKFVLAYLIPDVPKDVRLAVRREKYQVAKKFEDKGKFIDYTELVPAASYDDKVREDSANYADFEMDEEDTGSNVFGPQSPKGLPAVSEEQEDTASLPKQSLLGTITSLNMLDSDDENTVKRTYSSVNMWYEIDDGENSKDTPVYYAVPTSFTDSQGATSLRQVDPQGSNLLENTHAKDVKATKLSKNTTSAIGREPTNLESLENMSSAPSVFGKGRVAEEDEEESSNNVPIPNSDSVDPYSVVSNAEVQMSRQNAEDKDTSKC